MLCVRFAPIQEHTTHMTSARFAFLFAAIASPISAQARQQVTDTSHFRALGLPAPNEYRTGSGRPGPKYWQQKVDYKIVATLDAAKNELRGRETIHYMN